MDIIHLICVLSVAFTGLTSGAGVLPDGPLTAAVGGTVTFNPTITPPDKPFLVVGWIFYHNGSETKIITSTSVDVIGPEYVDRIGFDRTTGSLELRSLTLSDSGEYRVSFTPDGGHSLTGSTRLEILVAVSNVKVTVSNVDLVEFNSSVRLSCSSSGSSLSFLWLNGSSEVTDSDRVQLTDGNTNLTIVTVTRYDQGPFRCHVFNPVSNGTSEPVKLSISFGPENIILEQPSSQGHYEVGSNLELSCSAVSTPAAQFSWFLNRNLLPNTGPELRMTNIQANHSGNYSCQAFNKNTLRYQTSPPAAITISASLPQPSSCSAGCIAGIVIACCVVVGACAVAVYFIFYKKKQRQASNKTRGETQNTAANTQSQELNYADISSFQKRDGGVVQLGLHSNTTEYAQIRVNNPAAFSPPTYDVHMQRTKRQAPVPGANGVEI